MTHRRPLLKALAGAALAPWVAGALAQAFPARSIRMVCPYPPGATTDTVTRLVAAALQARSGVTVIVENRGGAGGNIGTEAVARGDADGHTVLLGALGPLAANEALYPKLGFNPAKDFVPLALAAVVPLVVVAHPAFPAQTFAEALKVLRASPGKFSYASAGNGTPQHLAGELFKQSTGTAIVHIPYRGSGPALGDLMGGQVQLMFEATPAVLQHVRSGRLKALAVTTAERIAALPQVPTLKESGVSAEVGGWYGFVAPSATPADRIAWLRDHLRAVLTEPGTQARLAELGSQKVDSSPQAFARLIETERARWGRLIRERHIQAD
ncbi:Bug family tripartite tricarboxylate transporter substrate binding protein [Roseateles sp. MS654]|uniref:Bug family tripartite tricarboxylate transporter substrate binding protein n=1 Tax=Roseateles sp. MS654 TaxID=3412685 RepID=UPI003C2EBF9A